MKKYIKGIFLLFGIFLLAFTTLAQAQSNEVSSTLELYKITTDENGEETAEQVTASAPGDTIEYRLTYTNNLSGKVTNLQANLPVPEGMEYLGTAQPAIDAASLQVTGNAFQSAPLQREVTLENGQIEQREIPANEYRRLQWIISSLDSQASITLTARVQVIDNTSR